MKVLALAFVLGLAVAAVPAASAHRGTGGKGYLSTVSGLEPNVVGIFVSVLSGDDRLRLSNYTHRPVTVLGYSGEPYLRFLRAGVFENVRSPNAYLDRFRYPPSRAPAEPAPRRVPRPAAPGARQVRPEGAA